MPTIIIPGLHSSAPAHWQSWFEKRIPGSVRVHQRNWYEPDIDAWSGSVRRVITRTAGKVVLVAHSFGVLASVHAARGFEGRVAAAFLVAPADPEKFGISHVVTQRALGFPAVVVASTNDPWMTSERAANWAQLWRVELVNLGAAGHINIDSGFGPWPEGLVLLEQLLGSSQGKLRPVAREIHDTKGVERGPRPSDVVVRLHP